MPNYYEIINVSESATPSEIENALDRQYNQIRRLVTHHDPEVVNKANQELQVLEKIRSVLLDPGKRSAYDAAISPLIGGLGDLELHQGQNISVAGSPIKSSLPSYSSVPSKPIPRSPTQRSWICPQCQTPNVINSQYCKKCGSTISSPCPACDQLVENVGEFCTHCGVNITQAKQKKTLEQDLNHARLYLRELTSNIPVLDRNVPELSKQTVLNGAWALVSLMLGLILVMNKPGKIPGVDLRVLLAGIVVLLVVTVFLSILRKKNPFLGFGALLAMVLVIGLPKTIDFMFGGHLTDSPNFLLMPLFVMVAFLYAITFGRILAITRKTYTLLKPYHSHFPNTGCLGGLFSLLLSALPLLYCYYSFLLVQSRFDQYQRFAGKYETIVFWMTGVQLIILGLILCIFSLLALRTALKNETLFRQNSSEQSEQTAKTTNQIQFLERAIDQIDLRSH